MYGTGGSTKPLGAITPKMRIFIFIYILTVLSTISLEPGYYDVDKTFFGKDPNSLKLHPTNNGVSKVAVLGNGFKIWFSILNDARTYVEFDKFTVATHADKSLVYSIDLEPQFKLMLHFVPKNSKANKFVLNDGLLKLYDATPNKPEDTLYYRFTFKK